MIDHLPLSVKSNDSHRSKLRREILFRSFECPKNGLNSRKMFWSSLKNRYNLVRRWQNKKYQNALIMLKIERAILSKLGTIPHLSTNDRKKIKIIVRIIRWWTYQVQARGPLRCLRTNKGLIISMVWREGGVFPLETENLQFFGGS